MLLICVDNHKYEYIEYLLKIGANVHTSGGVHVDDKELPLRFAIFDNDIILVELLLKYGADIKAVFFNKDEAIRRIDTKRINNKKIIKLIRQAFTKK